MSELISEAKLAHAVRVRDDAFSAAQLRLDLERVVLQVLLASSSLGLFGFLALLEVRKCGFSKHEVPLVRVVLDWASQDHVALLEMADVLAFAEAGLELELIE